MGILDKFRREGASGGYVSDLCIAKVSLTFYAFSLIEIGTAAEGGLLARSRSGKSDRAGLNPFGG